jgi:hypothetical protein
MSDRQRNRLRRRRCPVGLIDHRTPPVWAWRSFYITAMGGEQQCAMPVVRRHPARNYIILTTPFAEKDYALDSAKLGVTVRARNSRFPDCAPSRLGCRCFCSGRRLGLPFAYFLCIIEYELSNREAPWLVLKAKTRETQS